MPDNAKKFAETVNLDDYRKNTGEKLDPYVTSVTLDQRHKKFLVEHDTNLSELIRDFIDDLMKRKE